MTRNEDSHLTLIYHANKWNLVMARPTNELEVHHRRWLIVYEVDELDDYKK